MEKKIKSKKKKGEEMKFNDQTEKDLKKLVITQIEDSAFESAKNTINLILTRRKVIQEHNTTKEVKK